MKAFLSSPPLLLLLALSSLVSTTVTAATADTVGCFENAPFDPEDWKYCQVIIPDQLFLYYTPTDANVMLGLHAAKDAFGWSALAFGGNGGMKGASQYVVRRNETNDWIAEDRYSLDYTTPTLDEQQDVRLLFALQDEDDGQTAWGIVIPKDSCDPDDYDIEDHRVYMHWALGPDHTFGYHGSEQRGQFHANVLQAPKESPSTESLSFIDMTMPNVPVVLGEGGQDPTNPYICSFFDLQVLGESLGVTAEDKLHITRFAPVLAPESKQYVHHMILYSCSDREDDDDEDEDDDGPVLPAKEHHQVVAECESMPRGCSEMKWPWAVGSGDLILPDDVGMPIGQGQRWLVLQTHYYNPNLEEGVTDASGVRAYVTSDLREQEAGVMQLDGGTSSWQRPAIPVGDSEHQLAPLIVPGDCTSAIWDEPLNVVGVVHHMHLYGEEMKIQVERDGTNLGPMRHERHYDFNHQSLEEPSVTLRQLLPGDQITMDCRYDTTTAPENVSFGDLTQQEMCYAAIIYYPKTRDDALGYSPPPSNADTCLSPATEDAFVAANVSLCAQELYGNVPRFFDFEDESPPFTALDMCNGGEAFDVVVNAIPGMCPPCSETNTCTEEELIVQLQAFCGGYCNDALGVSAYPDTSSTEPFDTGNYACPETYFRTPVMMEADSCVLVGDTEEVFELKEMNLTKLELASTNDGSSETPTSDGSAVSLMLLPSGLFLAEMVSFLFY